MSLASGASGLYICEALRDVGGKKHIIIDPHQHFPHGRGLGTGWEGIGVANLERAGYSDMIEFHEEDSFVALPRLYEKGTRVEFAFIDGAHTFDYAFVGFFMVDKMLNVGGVIVFDDAHYPSVRKVCRYAATNLNYTCVGPLEQKTTFDKRRIFAALPHPLRRLFKPELGQPDSGLGIPHACYIGMQKTARNDLIGEGDGARRWDFHRAF